MSITYQGSKIIVEFYYERIRGKRGLGFYRLVFDFRYDITAWQDKEYHFKNPRAEVTVGISEKYRQLLGIAEPERPLLVKTRKFTQRSTTSVYIDLDKQRINAIEEIRKGGGLLFVFRIFGEVYENGNPWTAEDELRVPVNQTEWINVLKQMAYSDFLLFEVPLPIEGAPQELRDAVRFLEKANDHLMAGHYDVTIATCRNALDSLTKGLNEKKNMTEATQVYRDKQKRNTMSKDQRAIFIREAMRHYTHLAHHSADAGVANHYNRDDAAMTLSITAALLSHTRQRILCYMQRSSNDQNKS
jgi:hypothetical protein